MSDAPQGPGWWIASDGKWYPPQPVAPPQPAPASPPVSAPPPIVPPTAPPTAAPTPAGPPQSPPTIDQPAIRGPGGPPGFDPARTMVGPLDKPSNVLVIRSEGRAHAFVPGSTPSIGRDPTNDVIVDNPRVSRHHARASFDGTRWNIDDTNSSTGVWVDGRRMPRVALGGEMRVWLGPVAEGGELEITAPGSNPIAAGAAGGGSSGAGTKVALALIAVVAVVALVAVGILFATRSGNDNVATVNTPPPSTSVPPPDIDQAIKAVALLDVGDGFGSGSIISDDGMILTNAHVAMPNALGQAVELGQPGSSLEKPPKVINVLLAKGEGQKAEPAYQAQVLTVDGYLDIAVLQITKDADGNPVDRRSLHLPTITVGDSKNLKQASPISFVGYPGISGTKSVTVTTGTASGFLEDARLNDNRAWINSDAKIAGGNSGGAAIDETGKLVGVPTISQVNATKGEQISRARSVHLAQPVIAAAKAKRDNPNAADYTSPFVNEASGNEQITGKVTATKPATKTDDLFKVQDSCPSSSSSDKPSSGDSVIAVAIPYDGFADGSEDVLVVVADSDGNALGKSSNADTYTTPLNGTGCFVVTVPLTKPLTSDPKVVVFAGSDYQALK